MNTKRVSTDSTFVKINPRPLPCIRAGPRLQQSGRIFKRMNRKGRKATREGVQRWNGVEGRSDWTGCSLPRTLSLLGRTRLNTTFIH